MSTYLKQVRVVLFLHLTFNVTCIAPLLHKLLYSKPYLKVLLYSMSHRIPVTFRVSKQGLGRKKLLVFSIFLEIIRLASV